MSVKRELILSADVYTRDVGNLNGIVEAAGEAPKGYVCQSITIDAAPRTIRPYDPMRGPYLCTVTAVMVPWGKAIEDGLRAEQRDQEQRAGRLMHGISAELDEAFGPSQSESVPDILARMGDAERRAADCQEETRPSGMTINVDSPDGHRVPVRPVYQYVKGYGIPSAVEDARARADKLRAFHVEQIGAELRRQDEAARPAGIQPFPDRMAFSDHLSAMADVVRTMIPRPGGSEAGEYREILKGIAANCVRELDRLATLPGTV